MMVDISTCPSSGLTSKDFRDDLSRKEYKISGMCQECQDKFWGGSEFEEEETV